MPAGKCEQGGFRRASETMLTVRPVALLPIVVSPSPR